MAGTIHSKRSSSGIYESNSVELTPSPMDLPSAIGSKWYLGYPVFGRITGVFVHLLRSRDPVETSRYAFVYVVCDAPLLHGDDRDGDPIGRGHQSSILEGSAAGSSRLPEVYPLQSNFRWK